MMMISDEDTKKMDESDVGGLRMQTIMNNLQVLEIKFL
jgi:hypothetical protein